MANREWPHQHLAPWRLMQGQVARASVCLHTVRVPECAHRCLTDPRWQREVATVAFRFRHLRNLCAAPALDRAYAPKAAESIVATQSRCTGPLRTWACTRQPWRPVHKATPRERLKLRAAHAAEPFVVTHACASACSRHALLRIFIQIAEMRFCMHDRSNWPPPSPLPSAVLQHRHSTLRSQVFRSPLPFSANPRCAASERHAAWACIPYLYARPYRKAPGAPRTASACSVRRQRLCSAA